MLIYLARRLALALSVVIAALVASFLLFFAGPADPAQSMCAENHCPESKLADIRHSLGLDRPLPVQFGEYFKGVFVGREMTLGGNQVQCSAPCLGYSFHQQVEVKSLIWQKLPTTITLALMAMVVFLGIGIPTGIFAARRRGSPLDRGVVGLSQVFGAIPYYVVALIAMLYLTRLYPILPQAASISDGLGRWFIGMFAPALILGLTTATSYTRYTRAGLVDAFSQDYVRTARSKGISENVVTYRHALRAALSPVVTILGLDLAALFAGTLITEQIFQIDGIGRLAITALSTDDMPIIMGVVVVGAVVVTLMNLIVDIAYSYIDPRVRLS